MRKIASPQDLQAELQRLLAYSQGRQPSRERIASELRGLAERVAGIPYPFEEEDKKMEAQKGIASHLDFIMRGVTLSSPSMQDVRKLQRALRKGQAKASEIKLMGEDLDFDISQLQDKKDSKSKKLKKQIETMATFLKTQAAKLKAASQDALNDRLAAGAFDAEALRMQKVMSVTKKQLRAMKEGYVLYTRNMGVYEPDRGKHYGTFVNALDRLWGEASEARRFFKERS